MSPLSSNQSHNITAASAKRRGIALAAAISSVLTAGLHGVAAADGYDFPVVVPRSSGVADTVQLGEPVDQLEAPKLVEAPIKPAPVDIAAQQAAPEQGREPAQVALASRPQLFEPNGGPASAGYADSGTTLSLVASEKVLRAEYERTQEVLGAEDARVATGFLMSELRDVIVTGTLNLNTFPGLVPQVSLSVGPKLYVALLGTENRDVFALGVGARAKYELPLDAFPLSIEGSLHYAPDILAFGQSDRIIDWNVDAGLRLRDNLSAFVGARLLSFDTRPGTRRVEDDIHFGITWHFDDAAEE